MALPTLVASVTVVLAGAGAGAGGLATSNVELSEARRFSGAFGPAYVLEADRDGRLDVLTSVGGRPMLVLAPSVHQYSHAAADVVASALTVLPLDDAPDEFIAATSDGLSRMSFDSGGVSGRPEIVGAALGSAFGPASPYSSARALLTVDVDADGRLDLVALSADGRELAVAHRDANGDFTHSSTATLASEATLASAVEWGTGGAVRIALAGPDGVAIVAADGSLVESFLVAGDVRDIADVHEDGILGDALAVLAVLPGGATRIVLLREGALVDGPFELGAIEGVGLWSSDVDASGSDDLVVSCSGDRWVRTLRHQGPFGAPYLPAAVELFEVADPGEDVSQQAANPVAADFDGDGDEDVLHLVEPLRRAALQFSADVPEEVYQPELRDVDLQLDGPAPRVLGTVSVPPLPSGALAEELHVELWGELPGGPSLLGDHAASFLLGAVEVPLTAGVVDVPFEVPANQTPGELVYVNVRYVAQSGAELEFGVDAFWEFDRFGDGGGGGTGGGNEGSNGQGGVPPPSDESSGD